MFSKTTNQNFNQISEKDGDKIVIEYNNSIVLELTLNRPEKLNALDLHMQEILIGIIKLVNFQGLIISGRGERAFCAGGDIISIYQNLQKQNVKYLEDYLKAKYTLEYELEKLNMLEHKSVIVILNGMCVGGGYSLAQHSNYRICSENTLINFPGNISLFYINHLPQQIIDQSQNGLSVPCIKFLASMEKQYITNYMILTGSSLKGQELIYAGLADYLIPSNKIKMFKHSLQNIPNTSKLNDHILKYTSKLKNSSQIIPHDNLLQKYFQGNDLMQIQKKLEAGMNEWSEEERTFCKRCLSKIQKCSPLALRVNFDMIQKAADLSETQAYNLNHRVQYRLFNSKDFQESIHIRFEQKKTNVPIKWEHKSILEVTQQQVDQIFSPLKEQKLNLK